jgi:outer membrane lipoprotein SlyB
MNAMHPSGLPTGSSPKTHPLILAASMAVIFASATAVASMFGLIGSTPPKATTLVPVTSSIGPVSSAVAATASPSLATTPTAANEAVNEAAKAPIVLAPSASKAIQLPPASADASSRAIATQTRPTTTRTVSANVPVQKPTASATPTYPVIAQNPSPPAQDNTPNYPISTPPVQNAPVIASAPLPDYRAAPVTQNTVQAQYVDPNIGTVTSIREDQRKSQGSGAGAIAGGAVGGILGNQMGKGNGRAAATILGAIGGGLIGNEIEKSQRVVTTYVATVRMPDGATRNFNFSTRPSLAVGDQFDIRTAPSGSQAQYVKPRKMSPPETQRTDTMRSDNPYNT